MSTLTKLKNVDFDERERDSYSYRSIKMDKEDTHMRGTTENNKREHSFEGANDPNSPKRSCLSSQSQTSFEAEAVITASAESLSSDSWSVFEACFRRVVREVLESMIQSQNHTLESSPTKMKTHQIHDQIHARESISGDLKLKLCFLNQMASSIFTNNNIEAKDGEPLKVALCDVSNNNAIVETVPLSFAQIQIVVLNGDIGWNQSEEGTCLTVNDFNKSILNQREGRRPIIVGHDLTLSLQNGVGIIKNLRFTDNSRWTRSGKFRLGVRIKDPKFSVQFSTISTAISEPFTVKDHRGEGNKKLHPPKMEDEVWRLEGIRRGGVYHDRLSAHNITTVYDFLQLYQTNSSTLKEVIGNKVPNKTWKAMVDHAFECYTNEQTDPSTLSNPNLNINLQDINSMFQGEIYPSLIEECSTSYQCNYNHPGTLYELAHKPY